ncbi:hypothetical protein [uncultured Ruegeria sp.]|uniref:hypothetical protein n=1 Tax=uncultured Ruegeria sp. TaxID=259304 RepID=UPI002619759A|nr:hypothetical protein [uncultured Ruegeria sp.]
MGQSLPTIAGFWYGSDLSWLETLCIQSYLDNGHDFVLYTTEPISGVPVGADIRPASDILWPAPFDLLNNDRLRVAVFSDIFRLHLMQKTDFIWVDLDAYCVRPFSFDSPYIFGTTATGSTPNGVLRLPEFSHALGQLLEFVATTNPTQPWRGTRLQRKNRERILNGESWGIESLPWGCSGPKALAHFLRKTGEDRYAQKPKAFYPLERTELWKLHDPNTSLTEIEGDQTYSVHIYGHQKKWLADQNVGLPIAGSYLETICKRHSIDTAVNPIIHIAWMGP